MLNRLLEYNYSAVGIFIFITLLKLVLFFTGQTYSGEYDYSLFSIFNEVKFSTALLSSLSTVLLGIFVLINSERHAKRSDFSFWLVLIFALQMSFNSFFAFTVEHLGVFFFILSLYFFSKGLNDFDKSASIVDSFNLSFFIAVGTLFTPHLIYTLPLFLLCRIVIGTSSFRSFLASILGIALPFIIIDVIIFAFYADVAQYTHLFVLEQLSSGNITEVLRFNTWEHLSLLGPLFLLVYSLYITFANAYTMKTVVRKFNTVNLIILLYIGIALLLGFIPSHFGSMLFIVPTAYFYSNFHTLTSRAWQQAFLWIFLVSIALSYPPVIRAIISVYEMVF